MNIAADASDEWLVKAYKDGQNQDVLAILFKRYMGLVYGVCLKYLKQSEDAQDAVMQIYEELTTKLLKHEVLNFRPWLHTLARNFCLMELRKRKLPTQELTEPVMYSGENMHLNDGTNKELQLQSMEKCIETLPNGQKEAIIEFYLKEKSYKEIADESGMDAGKVRSYIQNGRRNLKICMEQQGEQA